MPNSRPTPARPLAPCLAALLGGMMAAGTLPGAEGPAPSLPKPAPDWKLELIAEAPVLRHPSVVCTAPDGRVFVAEDPMDISTDQASATEGRILCFHPDGRNTLFAENLHAVFGMRYIEGKLFVLHNPQFTVFTDNGTNGLRRENLIESTNPDPWAKEWNDHVPANFSLAMDGYLYVAVGDKGIYGAVGRDGKRVDLHGGGILRLRPDGTELEVYSTGTRNILDVGIDDEDNLFTYDNTDEKQWMSRLSHMVERGYYGYPYDFHPRQPWILWCMADYGAGAATGVFVDTEGRLPGRFSGNLFLADFGKRQVTAVRLERSGGTFRAVDPVELFPDPPADFRPVGICPTVSGTGFYLCDWQHRDTKEKVTVGRLFRLTHTEPRPVEMEQPPWYRAAAMGIATNVPITELLGGLEHPARTVRLTAQRQLALRGTEALGALSALLEDPHAAARSRIHAIWALDAIDHGDSAREPLKAALYSLEPAVRRQALRQLGTRRVAEAAAEITGRLEDEEPSVRFQAATALGRIGDPESVRPLTEALLRGEKDDLARFAMFTALNQVGRQNPATWPAIVQSMIGRDPEHRDLAPLVLRETYDPALVTALSTFSLSPEVSLPRRLIAIGLLADLHRQLPPWKGEWWVYHPVNQPPPKKSVDWTGTQEVASTLRRLLESGTGEIRTAAIEWIGKAEITSAAQDLRTLFDRHPDVETHQKVLPVLGRLHDTNCGPMVVALLDTPGSSGPLLEIALETAAEVGSPTNHLTPLLAASIAALSTNAALTLPQAVKSLEVLGRLRDPAALGALTNRLQDTNLPVAVAAIRALASAGGPASTLLPALQDPRPELLHAAVAAVGSLRGREAVPRLIELAGRTEFREEAFRALAAMPDLRALDLFVDHLASENFSLRDLAAQALGSLRKEALPRLEQRASTLKPEVLAAVQALYPQDDPAHKGPLFASQAAVRRPEDYLAHALAHPGSPLNGQRLFLNPSGVACVRCHRSLDAGGDVGPDLGGIGSQFDRRTLAESVLWPSKVVREGYLQTVLELRSGDTVAGLIKGESAESLTLRDAQGRNQTLPKTDIVSRKTSSLSLMPEGLHAALSPEEFTDLIAYLESLKSSTRGPFADPPKGFLPIFTGTNLSGWNPSGGTAPGWEAKGGILERGTTEEDLPTGSSIADFRLQLEWRWADAPRPETFELVDGDGNPARDSQGRPATRPALGAGEGGILVRGFAKAAIALSCRPVGSGDLPGYRTDPGSPKEVRAGVLPRRQADRPIGAWNLMEVVARGDKVTILLNGDEVVHEAPLPGLPPRGPIVLQHGTGRIQFRNLFVQPLE